MRTSFFFAHASEKSHFPAAPLAQVHMQGWGFEAAHHVLKRCASDLEQVMLMSSSKTHTHPLTPSWPEPRSLVDMDDIAAHSQAPMATAVDDVPVCMPICLASLALLGKI